MGGIYGEESREVKVMDIRKLSKSEFMDMLVKGAGKPVEEIEKRLATLRERGVVIPDDGVDFIEFVAQILKIL